MPSGRRRTAVAVPGVWRVALTRIVPPMRQSARSVPAANVPALKVNGGCRSVVPVSGDRVVPGAPLTDSVTCSQLLNTRTVVGEVGVHWFAM